MKKQRIVRFTSFFFVVLFIFTTIPFNAIAVSTSELNESREDLEAKLNEVNKKLEELGKEGKETEDYLSALDEKIDYMKKQYTIAKNEVDNIEKKIRSLENQIASNEKEIKDTKAEIKSLNAEVERLNVAFEDTYDEFCSRMRALYISGSTSSTLSFLLDSSGISQLLTRFEMISAISTQDAQLMTEFKEKSNEIIEKTDELTEKTNLLKDTQVTLTENKRSLTTTKAELVQKEQELKTKQDKIRKQQDEANEILKDIHKKTKEYGEFRDITQDELDEIDRAIEEADKKYQQVTTTQKPTTTTTTTTTKPSTTSNSGTSTTTTTTTTTKPTTNSKYISLTYPCPSYPTITCAFGAYSGHTGCDFSTKGNYNEAIVAAESGTVIISTDLTNPDGSYRSYGRYIVIRHDKTTSKGETVYTLYAHNNSRLVSEGEYVTKGQMIAKSGSTGNSTGPHCHFEVRVGGPSQSYAVNPAYYLP